MEGGQPRLARRYCNPTPVNGKKMDKWTDGRVMQPRFNFHAACVEGGKKKKGKQGGGDKSDGKQVDVRQLQAQSHIKRMLTSPLGSPASLQYLTYYHNIVSEKCGRPVYQRDG